MRQEIIKTWKPQLFETTKKWVLNEREIRLIKKCLDYCFHRISKHENSGISKVARKGEIDKLRKQIWI